ICPRLSTSFALKSRRRSDLPASFRQSISSTRPFFTALDSPQLPNSIRAPIHRKLCKLVAMLDFIFTNLGKDLWARYLLLVKTSCFFPSLSRMRVRDFGGSGAQRIIFACLRSTPSNSRRSFFHETWPARCHYSSKRFSLCLRLSHCGSRHHP